MLRHQLRLRSDIRGRQVRKLESLGLDPSKGLKVLEEEIVLGQLRRQFNAVVVTSLRNPGNGFYLLDLLVVGRRDAVQESRDLGAQICSRDESPKNVLRQDICVRPGVISNIISAGYDRAQGIAAQNAQNALAAAGLYDRNRTSELDRQMGATGLLGQAGSAQQQHAQRQIDAPYDITSWFQGFVPQVYDASQTSWGVQDTQGKQEKSKDSPSLFQQLLGLGGTILTSKDATGGTVGGSLLKSLLGN